MLCLQNVSTNKNFLPLYEAQPRDAEANIAIAETRGFEGVKDINMNSKEQLLKVSLIW